MRTIAILATLLSIWNGDTALAWQEATTRPAAARATNVELRPLRITEVRHVALQNREGPGIQPAVEAPAGLHLRLECVGRPVTRASEIGFVQLAGRDDRGRTIELLPDSPAPRDGFQRLDRRQMFWPNRAPANRIWVDLLLASPARDATTLDLEGSFQLQLINKKRVPVRELKAGPVEHPDLVAAGLTAELTRVGDTYVMLRLTGETERFDEANIFNNARQEIGLNSVRTNDPDALLITYELQGSTVGGSMQLTVEVPAAAVTIPVELKKIRLP